MLRRNAVPELPMTWRTITGTGQRRPGERLPPAYAAAERGRLPPRRLYQPLACLRGRPAAAGALRMVRKARTPSAIPEPERCLLGPSCLTGGSSIF
jgi:hypothetical protein